MTAKAKQVLTAAMKLSQKDRARIAAKLIGSLEADGEEDVEAAWAKEIEQRLAELDQGKVTTIPWSEVRRRLRGGR
jgi:putative addiction module component (TIGR02574 family)